MIAATTRRLARVVSVWAALAVAGCASIDRGPAPVTDASTRFSPKSPCGPEITVPQIVSTSPASFDEPTWERRARFEVHLRFRIDEAGAPQMIRATASGFDGPREPVEEAVSAALARYRFCMPKSASIRTDWSALMLYRYVRLDAAYGKGEMFVQQFAPAYSSSDLVARRAGRVAVRGTFDTAGHPISLGVASSSGDGTLDSKSLQAMASHQLVFRPGSVIERPVVFEQPYQYEIR